MRGAPADAPVGGQAQDGTAHDGEECRRDAVVDHVREPLAGGSFSRIARGFVNLSMSLIRDEKQSQLSVTHTTPD